MNRFMKIGGLVLIGLVAMVSSAWAAEDWWTDIDVNMPSVGSGELIVTPTDGAISFTPGLATLASPWVKSDGYLKVNYTSTYNATYCGVRIVSDISKHKDFPVGKTVVDCLVPAKTADGKNLYSGLIYKPDLDDGTTDEDPSKRAPWAWQVFNGPQAGITVPASSVAPDPNLGGSVVSDYSGDIAVDAQGKTDGSTDDDVANYPTTVGPWNAAWAYIGDKNDQGFQSSVWDPASNGPTYPMIVSGVSADSSGYLTPHPVEGTTKYTNPPAKAADGEIAVYLAAKFANTNWGKKVGDKPFAYVLSAGSYTTRLYVELIHE